MSTALATTGGGNAHGSLAAVTDTMDALKAIRTFIKNEFKDGVDFGVIPGTGTKNVLLLPGAQKAAMYFNAAPRYAIERNELGEGHVEFIVTTSYVHRATGVTIGEGVGSCSTMEKKYRYRGGERKCPHCGKEAIIKGKAEYGGGFLCFAKKGGCGTKFREDDPAITGQPVGQVENPDIWDMRNTVLKMAKKRSSVDASMSLACLSELFTQDIDETYDLGKVARHEAPQEPEAPPHARDSRQPTPATPPAKSPAPPRPQNGSGHKTGRYASPDQVEAYMRATSEFCADRNAEWADSWANAKGELPRGITDLIHPHQVTWHLLKWGVRTGKLADVGLRVDPSTNKLVEKCSIEQAKKYVAILFHRDRDAVAEEAFGYFEAQKAAAIQRQGHSEVSDDADADGWGPGRE